MFVDQRWPTRYRLRVWFVFLCAGVAVVLGTVYALDRLFGVAGVWRTFALLPGGLAAVAAARAYRNRVTRLLRETPTRPWAFLS